MLHRQHNIVIWERRFLSRRRFEKSTFLYVEKQNKLYYNSTAKPHGLLVPGCLPGVTRRESML